MGDMGDMYKGWNALKKEKKRTNQELILNLLTKNNISFTSKNMDSHLIVNLNEKRIDVWPTTNRAKSGIKYHCNAYQYLLSKIVKLNAENSINES